MNSKFRSHTLTLFLTLTADTGFTSELKLAQTGHGRATSCLPVYLPLLKPILNYCNGYHNGPIGTESVQF